MPRFIASVIALLLAAVPVVGSWAAELEGKIRATDPAERTVTLDSGVKLWIPEGTAVDQLKEGDEVKVSYEERDGRNIVTGITVK